MCVRACALRGVVRLPLPLPRAHPVLHTHLRTRARHTPPAGRSAELYTIHSATSGSAHLRLGMRQAASGGKPAQGANTTSTPVLLQSFTGVLFCVAWFFWGGGRGGMHGLQTRHCRCP
jgi:hypothetical protein